MKNFVPAPELDLKKEANSNSKAKNGLVVAE